MILAIDPGTTKSAWVLFDPDTSIVVGSGIDPNERVVKAFRNYLQDGYQIVIEMVACYGMAVGKEVFETCVWIGRFMEAFGGADLLYRQEVKLHLCHSARAKDANIRQALLDMFPATGGGSIPQIGTKKQPGPLYGVKADIWSALAVAITYNAKQRGAT